MICTALPRDGIVAFRIATKQLTPQNCVFRISRRYSGFFLRHVDEREIELEVVGFVSWWCRRNGGADSDDVNEEIRFESGLASRF